MTYFTALVAFIVIFSLHQVNISFSDFYPDSNFFEKKKKEKKEEYKKGLMMALVTSSSVASDCTKLNTPLSGSYS